MHQRPLTTLHPWLLNPNNTGAPYVVVDSGANPLIDCADKVCRLLNEYDDTAEVPWIALEPGIVRSVAENIEHRRLLGVDEAEPGSPPACTRSIRKILDGFARRGRFVLNHPEAIRTLGNDPRGFRVAIGRPVVELEAFHLIVNPTCFRPQCLATLVADSYLEWAAALCAA